MYRARRGVASNSAELDIDNAARAQLDRGPGVPCIGNTLIKTNWCADQSLKLGVSVDLIPLQRLLNH